MKKNKQNIDDFLRNSLNDFSVNPSKSVWKGITKRLLILEFLRLNFTNLSKTWLYSGAAIVATISGITYFSLTNQNELNETLPEKTTKQEWMQDADVSVTQSNTHGVNVINEKQTNENTPSEHQEKLNENSTGENNSDLAYQSEQNVIEGKNDVSTNLNQAPVFAEITTDISYNQVSTPEEINGLSQQSIHIVEKQHNILQTERHQNLSPQNIAEEPTKRKKKSNLNWSIEGFYSPEWPLTNEDIFVNNNQMGIGIGMELKKWHFNLGLGYRTEKTPSTFMGHYTSIDSVGFYYNIEYFDDDPGNPDSIIYYYTVENIYDSSSHVSQMKGSDQRRNWLFIPLSFGYLVHETKNYQLYANLNAKFGWEISSQDVYLEYNADQFDQMENLTPDSQSNYIQLGIGLENNIKLKKNWWLLMEPKVDYYINTPFIINNSSGNGPFSLSIKLGVKYKFMGGKSK